MLHVPEGELRRYLDDPFAVAAAARRHLERCGRCRGRLAAARRDATAAAALMAADPFAADAGRALTAVADRLAAGGRAAAGPVTDPPGQRPAAGWAAGGAAAAVAALLLAFTPVGSEATNLIAIFQPKQFVAVPVSLSELRDLPSLGAFGTVSTEPSGPFQAQLVVSAAAASQASGQTVRTAAYVPVGVPTPPHFLVLPAVTVSFTFSAAKAQAWATAHHETLPPMPADLDGSTLSARLGPAVAQVYSAGGKNTAPDLVVAQAPSPVVTSSGGSAAVIEQYLRSIPGLPPSLAAAIAAIGDPATTLPVPVPEKGASSSSVTIQGEPGLLVTRDSGGGAVLFSLGGEVYGVAGAVSGTDLVRVAASLR
jgi:hypothetical protein